MTAGTTHVAGKWQGYLPRNYKFYWSQVWIHIGLARKQLSCGSSGIKQWQLMNGGLTLHWPPSPNNVFFVSLTQTNQSNINFGIASKLGGLGDGPRSSCMSFVELELATMIASNGNKLYLGKGFLRNSAKTIKIWHFLRNITLWTIWIECKDKVFNHE